jgi:hypothetical protein
MATGIVPGRKKRGNIANRRRRIPKPITGYPLLTPKTGQSGAFFPSFPFTDPPLITSLNNTS